MNCSRTLPAFGAICRQAVVGLFVVGLLGGQAKATQYTITDLGRLGPSNESTTALAVNSTGEVVGTSTVNNGNEHAFLYSNGVITDLTPNAIGGTLATAINSSGAAVGAVRGTATLFSNGAISSLGNLGGPTSYAQGINSSGLIVGISQLQSGGPSEVFSYSNGLMTNLGSLGGGAVEGLNLGVNASGQIAGTSYTGAAQGGHENAFLYANGVMKTLGTLGGDSSEGLAINDSGDVVGGADTAGNHRFDAFLYSNGVITDIGGINGNQPSEAYSINNLGQVVGESRIDAFSTTYHAFLYENGTMIDLSTLLATNSGWELEDATGINDAGQITGYGVTPDGRAGAFLLTPTPEPASYAFVSVILMALLRRRSAQLKVT